MEKVASHTYVDILIQHVLSGHVNRFGMPENVIGDGRNKLIPRRCSTHSHVDKDFDTMPGLSFVLDSNKRVH